MCAWISRAEALRHFATCDGPTRSQQHIKPLHWYVASRLVLEGGFLPDDIAPRPPFRVERGRRELLLHYDETQATGEERTVLGGLKTKNVDVVIARPTIGPALAVSCKGMTGALRNLTNRMEELIGECTNLHITYPALVFGFLFVVRANRRDESAAAEVASGARRMAANDVAFQADGGPVASLVRFHNALCEITGRRGIRDDVSRYEAVSLLAVEAGARAGAISPEFPTPDSPLRIERFFETLYRRYDERFVFGAPDLKARTARPGWSPDSPCLRDPRLSAWIAERPGIEIRLSSDLG
ncbi:hypothetical protein GCM10010964_39230 [Caldovatus sediminis]|uniref:Uncharacterized protein n=1 Tax=Caldovatus sediminis TaxID=2041189 RepID=A0A8J3EDV2_9PROT|nr:hypothetical protein [Caldovatus sediminis]GGG48006.1 hypothetical protein GCM10010964_39230 [Caldovatus sediminis]